MALQLGDRIRDTATTTGTGAFTVSGTAPITYRTLSAVLSTNDTFDYFIQHQTLDEWEVGTATYNGSNAFTRTTVRSSSNAGAAVNFSAGTKDVVASPQNAFRFATVLALNEMGSTGLVVRTATGPEVYLVRSVAAPAAGISVSNPSGIAGNITLALADDLAAIEALSGTGPAFRTGTSAWSLLEGQLAGFRNRIINGDFQIDQRNSGAAVSCIGARVFGADKWYAEGISPGVFSLTREADALHAGQYRLKIACTTVDTSIAAGDWYGIEHFIEGPLIRDFDPGLSTAKQVTLSFEVECNITGTWYVSFGNSAANRAYIAGFTVNSANTRENKSIAFVLDTTGTWLTEAADIGMRLYFTLMCGSNYNGTAGSWAAGNAASVSGATNFMGANTNIMRLRNVQLEIGAAASQFEYLPYDVTFKRCQRYFQRLNIEDTYDIMVAPGFVVNAFYGIIQFPRMMKIPTITSSAMATWSGVTGGTGANWGTPDSFAFYPHYEYFELGVIKTAAFVVGTPYSLTAASAGAYFDLFADY